MGLFEYLLRQEDEKPGFIFSRISNGGLAISYPGYKHMDLFEIRVELQKTYKLKFDFKRGLEEFDQMSGRTFVYFKNVYKD